MQYWEHAATVMSSNTWNSRTEIRHSPLLSGVTVHKHLAFQSFTCTFVIGPCRAFISSRQQGEAGAQTEHQLSNDGGGKAKVWKTRCLCDLAQGYDRNRKKWNRKKRMQGIHFQMLLKVLLLVAIYYLLQGSRSNVTAHFEHYVNSKIGLIH